MNRKKIKKYIYSGACNCWNHYEKAKHWQDASSIIKRSYKYLKTLNKEQKYNINLELTKITIGFLC